MNYPINARYPGTCNQCGTRFGYGTRIIRVGEGAYEHLNCDPGANQDRRPGRGPAANLSGGWCNQGAGGWQI